MICGCVEVTPPSGTTGSSAYGSAGSTGNLTSGQDNKTPTAVPTGTGAGKSANQVGPNEKLPTPPEAPVVRVTPRSLEGLPTPAETQSYSAMNNQSAIGPGEEFVPIYEINHSFSNDAIAYAYTVENPPLYVDLKFSPVMGNDVISYQKRTGDKEGQIDVTVNRPLKDAWFEMRVYNQNDGSEVLREGYGKTYSQSNKTVAIRTSGTFQFDFVGNFMNATVILKVPVNQTALSQYENVTGMIDTKNQAAGLVPGVFLVLSDLPSDWKVSGDVIHTSTEYQSIFSSPSSGYKLQQNIKKFDSTDKALAALANLKNADIAENPAATLIGQAGFQFESVRKTEVAFVQNLYLVELVSYSVPSVSLNDLQRYGGVLVSRINSAG